MGIETTEPNSATQLSQHEAGKLESGDRMVWVAKLIVTDIEFGRRNF
ncbi:MAG: hypothetical protein ACP5D7_01290 [Limnospira sp.]